MLKTTASSLRRELFAAVSIPHRYAENEEERIREDMRAMFQSLIGMLKTVNKGPHGECGPFMFQSLIGMLKTRADWRPVETMGMFQSLIGMLKTGSENA